MQMLNDPTHPVKHYFDSRRSNRSGNFLLPRTNTNRYKASFLPSALSVFIENLTVIDRVCACVMTSAEDNFAREDMGCVYLMIRFSLRVFMFWFVRDNIIPGNLGFARY